MFKLKLNIEVPNSLSSGTKNLDAKNNINNPTITDEALIKPTEIPAEKVVL
jgi:hypothetical protein